MAHERYDDTPLSNFPVGEDNWSRMSDLSISLLAVAKQYSELYNSGNIDSANALLERYPDLKLSLFTPDRWNQLRDAIIALERFFLEDIDTMLTEVAQSAIGINDDIVNSDEASKTNTYSAFKINTMINSVQTITLKSSAWSSTAPYTQRVDFDRLLSYHSPLIVIDDSQTKAVRKAQAKQLSKHVDRVHTNHGYFIFECDESKPTTDIVLSVKGI